MNDKKRMEIAAWIGLILIFVCVVVRADDGGRATETDNQVMSCVSID